MKIVLATLPCAVLLDAETLVSVEAEVGALVVVVMVVLGKTDQIRLDYVSNTKVSWIQ